MEDILHSSISQLTDLFRTGKVSPVELIEATFSAINQSDAQLNAFIALFEEAALEEAKQAEKEIRGSRSLGPLHGIPIALKDIIHVAETTTTCGSKFYATGSSQFDAAVAARLKAAGAIIIGKTNLHEFAFGVTTENPHFGATANPWDLRCIPGGSSGGSGAAVVAGFCAGAIGTDTGGSIRVPSALCGNVGLKPTYGRVSVQGIVELAQSLDCVGPMCRYVEDVAIMMNALAGYDREDVHAENRMVPNYADNLGRPISGLKAGIPKQHFFDNLDADVNRLVADAIKTLEELGLELIELDVPFVADAHEAALTILMAEASYFHKRWFMAHREDYGRDLRDILEVGQELSASDYIRAVRKREIAQRNFVEVFTQLDLILCPTVPIPAPHRSMLGQSAESESNKIRPRLTQNTRVFNLLGLPALSVPCGLTKQGVPVGLQISGQWWSEKNLLQIAHAYEQTRPPAWPGLDG